jgi:hypothetical protein
MLYFRFTEHSTFVRLLPIICICFTECRLESDDTSLAYKQSDYGNLSLRSRLIQATTLNSEPPDLGGNCRHAVENKIMDTTDSNYIYSRARTRIAQSRVASSCFRKVEHTEQANTAGRVVASRLQISSLNQSYTPPAQESRAKLANI